jgi:hypothetical protein
MSVDVQLRFRLAGHVQGFAGQRSHRIPNKRKETTRRIDRVSSVFRAIWWTWRLLNALNMTIYHPIRAALPFLCSLGPQFAKLRRSPVSRLRLRQIYSAIARLGIVSLKSPSGGGRRGNSRSLILS